MSRSINAEMQISVRQQLMQELAASPNSRLVRQLAQPLLRAHPTPQGIGDPVVGLLATRAGALRAKAGWEKSVQEAAPTALADAQRLLGDAEGAMGAGDRSRAVGLAREGDERLREALQTTAGVLATEERRQAAGVLEHALSSIGCRTTLQEEGGFTGMSAERGHQRLVALVEDGGGVKLDIAGCEGDACEPLQRELERAVRDRGGRLTNVRSKEHRDDRGGVMMQRAALAAGTGTLADGVVRQAIVSSRRKNREGASTAMVEQLRQGG